MRFDSQQTLDVQQSPTNVSSPKNKDPGGFPWTLILLPPHDYYICYPKHKYLPLTQMIEVM